MRGFVGVALAGSVAALLFAGPTAATALPASATVAYGQANEGVLQQVGKRDWRGWKGNRYSHNWYKGYRYRPYAYGYRGYGYRPYAYNYGYYPYYRRGPGVSLWFGF